MKNILLTGGTGFIGRNIKDTLECENSVFAPTREELNLLDQDAVDEYITQKKIDVVIHSANPNPVKNKADKNENMFEDSLRAFMNLYQIRTSYERMIYLGSGAEYGKTRDISLATEDIMNNFIPKDSYGFAKKIMNELTESSENVFNARIFGCYGPTDHNSKFITHAIECCMRNEEITIRQNCYFDYMQVRDLGRILNIILNIKLKYHTYNVCSGTSNSLVAIAEEVRRQMKTKNSIVMLQDGLNKEYTGNNTRLLEEIGTNFNFTSLEEGIKIQIESVRGMYK